MSRQVHVPPYENIPFDAKIIREFQERYCGKFPDEYFAIDVETSGLDKYRDKIIQIGIMQVKNRKPLITHSFLINWFPHLSSDDGQFLRSQMGKTKVAIEFRGKRYPWTPELLEMHGEPPLPVAEAVRRVLGEDPFCVGHFAWNFDFPRIYAFMKEFASSFDVDSAKLYDTCLMTRAAINSLRGSGVGPIGNYYDYVDKFRTGPPCRLQDCVDRFGLAEKGAADHSERTTDAGYDAWCAHMIFEKHREAADAAS